MELRYNFSEEDGNDAIVAVFASLQWHLPDTGLENRKESMIYNLVLAFVTEMVILLAEKWEFYSFPDQYHDPGLSLVMISTLGVINGLRDVVQRNFTSGSLEIMNSVLGALGIAFGIALAMKMLHGGGNAGGQC